jgi:hypothetical protein
MKWCSQVLPHPDFVAVETKDFGDGKMECACDFNGGLPGDVDGTDYSPSAEWYYSYYSGVGHVQSSDGSWGYSCYRYHVSFLGCMGGFFTYCILLTVASFVYMKLELHPFLPGFSCND